MLSTDNLKSYLIIENIYDTIEKLFREIYESMELSKNKNKFTESIIQYYINMVRYDKSSVETKIKYLKELQEKNYKEDALIDLIISTFSTINKNPENVTSEELLSIILDIKKSFKLSEQNIIAIGLKMLINNYLLMIQHSYSSIKLTLPKYNGKIISTKPSRKKDICEEKIISHNQKFRDMLRLVTFWSNISIKFGSVFENEISLIKHFVDIIKNKYTDISLIKEWITQDLKSTFSGKLERYIVNSIILLYPNDIIIS